MELLYSMRRKPLKCEPPQFDISDPEVIRPIVTISVGNIIAFSSHAELTDTVGNTWGGHVYVCDVDTPWDCHKVTSTAFPVSALEWDMEGKQLLVATTVGEMQVFGQKDYLLNEWMCLYSATFPEERIIKAIFFHNGRRIVSVDKKPDALITERLQALRVTPTLKGFGGVHRSGVVAMSASGLVVCAGAGSGGSAGSGGGGSCAALPRREHVRRAAFTANKGGIIVAAVCGTRIVTSAINIRHTPLTVTLQTLPAITLNYEPTSICWSLYEDCDSLLIGGATVTMATLSEHKYPIHKLLCKAQGNTTPGGGQKPGSDCFTTLTWHLGPPRALDNCKVSDMSSSRTSSVPPYTVILADNRLMLMKRGTHLVSSVVIPGTRSTDSHPAKKPKYSNGHTPENTRSNIISSCSISALSALCVVIDSRAQIYTYTLPQDNDMSLTHLIEEQASLLEYSVVAGYDPLDLILSWKPNLIDAVHEIIMENFQRQTQQFQQFYSNSWLKLRIALCKSSSSPIAAASWSRLTSSLMLISSWASVADRTDYEYEDVTNHQTLLALESKDLSPDMNLLPLRRILQRAVDVAITMLASPPNYNHGYNMWLDPLSLSCVRACVSLSRNELAPTLCRLLARPPRDDSNEECAIICSQSTSPRVWEALPRCCVSSPHGKPRPFYLEYGIEPESLRTNPEPPFGSQCDVAPSTYMDGIRYMYLGGGLRAARWRQCGRCGCRALWPGGGGLRHNTHNTYDTRFTEACRCGGKWTLISNY